MEYVPNSRKCIDKKKQRRENNMTKQQRNARTQKAVVELATIEEAQGIKAGPGFDFQMDDAEVGGESMWEESKKEKDKRRLLERWADHGNMLVAWYVSSMASGLPDIGLTSPVELPSECNCEKSKKIISFYMLLSN